MKGFSIKFALSPVTGDKILDPIDKDTVDYPMLMLGWITMSIFWPITWGVMVGNWVIALLLEGLIILWKSTLGNEKLAKKIFGG